MMNHQIRSLDDTELDLVAGGEIKGAVNGRCYKDEGESGGADIRTVGVVLLAILLLL